MQRNEQMRVFGIDVDSFKIAIAVFEDEKLQSTMVLAADKKKLSDERAFELYGMFNAILDQMKPDHVAMEKGLYNQNFTSSRTIAEVVAYCKLACSQHKIPYELYAVTSWKKAFVGKGNATKDEIMEKVVEIYPSFDGITQDECDGVAIGYKFLLDKLSEESDE